MSARRKQGRNKRKIGGKLLKLTVKEKDKRDERAFNNGKLRGKDKVKVHAPARKVK